MKFLGQGFQMSEPEQDKQTEADATENITTPHSRVVITLVVINTIA